MPNSERSYSVWLHDRRVGTLAGSGGYTRFVLDGNYVSDPRRAVLGLRFEEDLHATYRSNIRLPPWFSNLLPEGRLREWIADARNVSETHELELLAEVGHDLPGAVRVMEGEDSEAMPAPVEREVLSDTENPVSKKPWRFSLAGVALKFSMLKKGERFTAPAVGEGGDWIVKLPDSVYPQVPLNEFAMMEFARASGLDVPETRMVHRDDLDDVPSELWPSNEDFAYAIRRFDREPGGKSVHMEDLAQVRGFYPDEKYRGSFETIGSLIYRGRDSASLVEFAKRLAFIVLIRNGDAHLKNWSLLYEDPRIPRLSPVYDMVATAVYRPEGQPEDLGLRFGNSRDFQSVSLARFARLQRKLDANDISLVDEVRDFVGRVRSAWPKIAGLLENHPFILNGIDNELNARASFVLRK